MKKVHKNKIIIDSGNDKKNAWRLFHKNQNIGFYSKSIQNVHEFFKNMNLRDQATC